MKKPVTTKYRGVPLMAPDKFIFGDALTGDGNYILELNKRQPEYGYSVSYHIKPNSAALLIGYDINGEEIYEGDAIIDDLGREITADFHTSFCHYCTLKKEPDNETHD